MRIKENYVLRQVADTWVVLPVGDAVADFNGMISLNESGSLLWKKLEEGSDLNGLASALTEEYDVTEKMALKDAETFVCKLRNSQMLVD